MQSRIGMHPSTTTRTRTAARSSMRCHKWAVSALCLLLSLSNALPMAASQSATDSAAAGVFPLRRGSSHGGATATTGRMLVSGGRTEEDRAAVLPSVVNSQDYPPIQMKKDARIVIVGGGPAGLHFATVLVEKGFTNITVLEAESEVGGKTRNVHLENDPVSHAMGAIFFAPYFQSVYRKVLRKYDPKNKMLNADPFLKKDAYVVLGSDIGNSDLDAQQGMDFKQFFLRKAAVDANLPPTSPLVYGKLAAALVKYVRVHNSIFGKYPQGVPPPPHDWSKIDMSAREFLKANGLMAMEVVILFAYQLNGFGTLEGSSAFYMLYYMHPAVIRSFLQCLLTQTPYYMLPSEGIQKIFTNMAQYHEKDGSVQVRRGARVTAVTRGLTTGGPIRVTYTDAATSTSNTVEADYVVMALDLKRYASLVQDLQAEETDALSGMEGSLYQITLYDSDPTVPVDRPVIGWFSRMTFNASRDGAGSGARLHGLVNEAKVSRGKAYKGSDGTIWYGNATGRQRRLAYQWMEDVTSANMTQWNETLLKDFSLLGQTNVAVISQAVWPYITHFNRDALKNGNPWKVLKMQGERNTFWIGSSVCFETTVEVMKYNLRLARRIRPV